MLSAKLKKRDFVLFLEAIKDKYELIAPIKTDITRYKKITDISKITLEEIPDFPVKEWFFKKDETMFEFQGQKIIVPKEVINERVFFGLRECDLNAIMHQDKVFIEEYGDPYYFARREKSILVGYHCKGGDEYCFCESLDLKDFFDVMIYERSAYYLLVCGTENGERFLKKFKKFIEKTDEKATTEDKKLNTNRLKKKDLGPLYENKDWEKGAKLCLSCGACNLMCPTCYCFNMYDDVSLADLSNGTRKRTWGACQLKSFTRVAGDHIFRDERLDRFKHRIYHQLHYFKERHGIHLCTGCGRCIRGCPKRIDFVDIANKMKDGKRK